MTGAALILLALALALVARDAYVRHAAVARARARRIHPTAGPPSHVRRIPNPDERTFPHAIPTDPEPES